MSFIRKKPKTISVNFFVNVHEGEEERTVQAWQQVLARATPQEADILARLFNNDCKRKQALTLAEKFL
ncbi:MAG: hypothetical protein KatS3mg031_0198 [Chitinophagales bacterium]|nr:MAG: hypothetical protein KatS3mg031_0198 [Chitinophagales bacterium]